MNKIDRLVQSYSAYISIPWRADAAPDQRVIFCVYDENDELRLRAKIDEFEIVTKKTRHEWALFDLTETFPLWLSSQRYAEKYYQSPELLPPLLAKYQAFLAEKFSTFLLEKESDENCVVGVMGVGSLFGFLKVKEVVDKLAPMVKGRLLVFFPGSYENNNYRLLDAYDGWNYMAVTLIPEKTL